MCLIHTWTMNNEQSVFGFEFRKTRECQLPMNSSHRIISIFWNSTTKCSSTTATFNVIHSFVNAKIEIVQCTSGGLFSLIHAFIHFHLLLFYYYLPEKLWKQSLSWRLSFYCCSIAIILWNRNIYQPSPFRIPVSCLLFTFTFYHDHNIIIPCQNGHQFHEQNKSWVHEITKIHVCIFYFVDSTHFIFHTFSWQHMD